MSQPVSRPSSAFAPSSFATFRFVDRRLDPDGRVSLTYALDDRLEFTERFELPVPAPLGDEQLAAAEPLLDLLHLVAGVSYFKTAVPPEVAVETTPPTPAVAELLEALYSEGLGEFAYRNELPGLPRPRFPRRAARAVPSGGEPGVPRTLVPIGGGKDSLVAVEVLRRSGQDFALFSVGDPEPIARTAAATGVERHVARRTLDPSLHELNEAGALNGHVPVTAIVSCAALLTARLNGFTRVAMANERSASDANLRWNGTAINHQFSKGLACERLLRAALAEVAPDLGYFSVLRPASELAIARAFARYPQYHDRFTSCNAVFRLDPTRRAANWCGDCPKCRFVFLALAPFLDPERLVAIFGRDLLDDEGQYEGFALLAAVGGHKPFECVGEEEESIAAFRLLAADERWKEHAVVRRFASTVLPTLPDSAGDPEEALRCSAEHHVPSDLVASVDEVLGC